MPDRETQHFVAKLTLVIDSEEKVDPNQVSRAISELLYLHCFAATPMPPSGYRLPLIAQVMTVSVEIEP